MECSSLISSYILRANFDLPGFFLSLGKAAALDEVFNRDFCLSLPTVAADFGVYSSQADSMCGSILTLLS